MNEIQRGGPNSDSIRPTEQVVDVATELIGGLMRRNTPGLMQDVDSSYALDTRKNLRELFSDLVRISETLPPLK